MSTERPRSRPGDPAGAAAQGPRALPSRGFAPARLRLAALAGLVAIAGCRHDPRPAGGPGDPEEHAGHVIPAHRPRSLPEAVRRLRELDEAIGRATAGGRGHPPHDDGSPRIALDIASWLPEIAAEGDLPEGPWDEVAARSGSLVAAYRTLAAPAGDAPAALRDARRDVAELEAIVARSDPRCFDKAVGTGGPP